MAIKVEAMKKPCMRSKEGTLGEQSSLIMDRLARRIEESGLAHKVGAAKSDSLSAKFVQWALDRKARPNEYRRIAELYVDRPATMEEAIVYYSRPFQGNEFQKNRDPRLFVPRVGKWYPLKVEDADRDESLRLIWEYHYFMPPKGLPFNEDSRIHLANVLTGMINPTESLIVFVEDAQIRSRSPLSKLDRPSSSLTGINGEAYQAMINIPSSESFKALSRFFLDPSQRELIQNYFKVSWNKRFGRGWTDQEMLTHRKAWVALAEKDWGESHEVSFGTWLLEQPVRKPDSRQVIDPAGVFAPSEMGSVCK